MFLKQTNYNFQYNRINKAFLQMWMMQMKNYLH